MKGIAIYQRSAISISVIVLSLVILAKCINNDSQDKEVIMNADGEQFSGSGICANCHKTIYDSHINTAHFHTSEIVSEKNIKGSFDSGKNTFIYSSGAMVKMEKRAMGFYQAAYTHGVERVSQRFDIITGSGTKGQSYLTWSGANLFQLPITYLTSVNQWCNSPGNPNKIALNRVITSRCLECHATFVQNISAQNKGPEEFDKHHMVLGVDCERCHGPAARHVEFQTQNPNETKGAFIINPARFTRQQSIDMCALCHGGRLQKIKPSFEFKAGDKLSDYFFIDTSHKDAASIDVHGNQFGLLASSKCFIKSKTLTCNTCHNPHENEKGKTALFSQRCISCHNDKNADVVLCKLRVSVGPGINENCIDCHMPPQPSKAIAVLLQGDSLPTSALIRTHLIKNYPDETKKMLTFIKK